MRYRYRYPVKEAESNETSLPIREAVILECERRTIEDIRRIDKVDAVILEVLEPFSLVPFEPHLRSVYTRTP